MKRISRVVLGAVLCLRLGGPGPIGAERSEYTVGEFAVGLARTITGKADYTPESAAAVLSGMGAQFSGDLAAEVHERFFADAFNHFGLDLVTSSPDRAMTKKDADKLLGAFTAGETHAGNAQGIKCKGNGPSDPTPDPGGSFGQHCFTDADCPFGFCKIPDGLAKKLASVGEP